MSDASSTDGVFPHEPVLSENVGTPPPIPDIVGADLPGPRRASLGRNSAARLASDVSVLALSLVAATLTARLFGPSGKGYYSSLILLAGILVVFFSAGLGEASIVLAARGRFSMRTATSATLLATAGLSVLGGMALVAVAHLVLGADSDNARAAVVLAGLLTAVNVNYNTFAAFLVAKERVTLVSALAVVSAGIGTVTLWFFVAVLDLGTAGAILGSVVGSVVVLVASTFFLRSSNLPLRPAWVPSYLRSAIPFGASLQISNLLVMITARLDLILVYRLRDSAAAGRYSVALTLGTVVASVPSALSYASFPRLAGVDDDDARDLTAQLFRMGMVAALACGALVAVTAPLAVPLLFGRPYLGAVAPTLVLVPGGILWSGQWILCRAAAARGAPRPLLVSFVTSFVTMVLLDFVLIGPLGSVGAALASAIAGAVGLVISLAYYRRWGWRLGELAPRPGDVVALVRAVRRLGRMVPPVGAGEGSPMRQ